MPTARAARVGILVEPLLRRQQRRRRRPAGRQQAAPDQGQRRITARHAKPLGRDANCIMVYMQFLIHSSKSSTYLLQIHLPYIPDVAALYQPSFKSCDRHCLWVCSYVCRDQY